MQLIITNSGRAALAAAIAAGTTLSITDVAIGSGKYTAAAAATALQTEIKRLPAAGDHTTAGVIHVTAIDDSTASYSVGEIGLITSTGVLLAVYSQASWIVQKASASDLVLALDIAISSADAAAITFGDTDFLLPAASSTKAGVVRLATSTEIDAGTAAAAVDAAQLQAWKGRVKTDSTTTNDTNKLATSAAVYALTQLINANTNAISTINNLLTSDNVSMDTLQEIVDVIEAATGTLGSLAIANIAGLQTALDGKAAYNHTHTIANVTGLQTALDGKLSTPTAGKDFLAAMGWYSGEVNDGGGFNILPSSAGSAVWSASESSTDGFFTLQHNLGHMNYSFVATPINAPNNTMSIEFTRSHNSVDVHIADIGNNNGGVGFGFILVNHNE